MDVLTHLMFQDGNARAAAEWYVALVPGSSIERDGDHGFSPCFGWVADRCGVSWQVGVPA